MLWVKGHQDKYMARHKLSQQAGMNMIRADGLADQYRERNQYAHKRNQLSLSQYDQYQDKDKDYNLLSMDSR
jgi:hypothetical protein